MKLNLPLKMLIIEIILDFEVTKNKNVMKETHFSFSAESWHVLAFQTLFAFENIKALPLGLGSWD